MLAPTNYTEINWSVNNERSACEYSLLFSSETKLTCVILENAAKASIHCWAHYNLTAIQLSGAISSHKRSAGPFYGHPLFLLW